MQPHRPSVLNGLVACAISLLVPVPMADILYRHTDLSYEQFELRESPQHFGTYGSAVAI
jgi:hypothetical protein